MAAISINKTANVIKAATIFVPRVREQTWNLFIRGLFTRSKYDKYFVAGWWYEYPLWRGVLKGRNEKTVRDASCFRSTIARRNLLKMVKDERSCTSLPPGSFVRFPIKIPSGSTELLVYICIRNRPDAYICTYEKERSRCFFKTDYTRIDPSNRSRSDIIRAN